MITTQDFENKVTKLQEQMERSCMNISAFNTKSLKGAPLLSYLTPEENFFFQILSHNTVTLFSKS